MHQGIVDWVRATCPPELVTGKRVLEVGSRNLVGTMRPWFEETLKPAEYVGLDLVDGDGVDVVLDAKHLVDVFGPERWDLILCLEMLEHCDGWQEAVYQMKESLVDDGWLILTTRSPGYPYHWPPDLWRYPKEVLVTAFSDLEEVQTWSDPGYVGTNNMYFSQPGVFIRGRRNGPVDRFEAEAVPVYKPEQEPE